MGGGVSARWTRAAEERGQAQCEGKSGGVKGERERRGPQLAQGERPFPRSRGKSARGGGEAYSHGRATNETMIQHREAAPLLEGAVGRVRAAPAAVAALGRGRGRGARRGGDGARDRGARVG